MQKNYTFEVHDTYKRHSVFYTQKDLENYFKDALKVSTLPILPGILGVWNRSSPHGNSQSFHDKTVYVTLTDRGCSKMRGGLFTAGRVDVSPDVCGAVRAYLIKYHDLWSASKFIGMDIAATKILLDGKEVKTFNNSEYGEVKIYDALLVLKLKNDLYSQKMQQAEAMKNPYRDPYITDIILSELFNNVDEIKEKSCN